MVGIDHGHKKSYLDDGEVNVNVYMYITLTFLEENIFTQ